MVDMSSLRGLGVRYGSTNQANSALHPFGVGKWVVINVNIWITEVETIKLQAGTVCGCLVVRLARMCGLSLQPIVCTICPSLWRTALRKLQLLLYKCYAFIGSRQSLEESDEEGRKLEEDGGGSTGQSSRERRVDCSRCSTGSDKAFKSSESNQITDYADLTELGKTG